ncbi:hypothetical protein SAMN05660297_01763 [Natronincola peptidivorans]|uniref:Uncharacterized protein n=1 Tax=Natronincola peptidivorans TaxID=426128 RepID=A0A1I0CU14_9FIRM|nr:hypothetical protein [Natronincola peptidivorans]SET23189.1 hypothetical protein SAMN05660297_01763 [Natronincola peptidivorans]
MKRRYRRYFVILEEEDKGFSISKSEGPKGYGKIEVRNDHGTLSLHCQNLKQLDEKKERYRLYLIHTKDTEEPVIVDVGPLQVDKHGKGEAVWEFNAENVKGFRKAIEVFDVLVLAVEPLEESQRIIAPLVGYIHKEKTRWKPLLQKKLFITTKEEEKPEQKQEAVAPKEEKKLEKKQEAVAPKEEKKLEKKQEAAVPKEEKKPEKKQEAAAPKEEKPTSSYSFEKDWDTVEKANPAQQYIESTLKIFPKVEPFDRNLENYEWWQIQYNAQTLYRTYMPFIAHIETMINPYYYHYPYYQASEYQRQLYGYQHYVFGICYDEKKRAKYYVYGIPGKKTSAEQPYKGKTGFVYWHPSHYQQFNQEGFGYWLMHIDAETGKVVEPLEATKAST